MDGEETSGRIFEEIRENVISPVNSLEFALLDKIAVC